MLNSSPFCPKPTALCSGLSRCSPSLLSLRRRCHHLLHQKQLIATAGTTSSGVKDSWGLQISQDEDDCVQSTSPLPMPARMGLVLPAIHLQITATTTRHCLHIPYPPNNNSESQWKRMKRVNKGTHQLVSICLETSEASETSDTSNYDSSYGIHWNNHRIVEYIEYSRMVIFVCDVCICLINFGYFNMAQHKVLQWSNPTAVKSPTHWIHCLVNPRWLQWHQGDG